MRDSRENDYYKVAGDSMWPLLRAGDRVLARRVDPERLRPGDIVLYRGAAGQVVCHRFVRYSEGPGGPVMICRADTAGARSFESVPGVDLIGRATALARGRRIYSLDKGLLAWHRCNRWAAPLCAWLIMVKNFLR